MVLKKIEAAGDMTATEITIAWRSPSALRRRAGVGVASEEEVASLLRVLLWRKRQECWRDHDPLAYRCRTGHAGSRRETCLVDRAWPGCAGSHTSADRARSVLRRFVCASCPSVGDPGSV